MNSLRSLEYLQILEGEAEKRDRKIKKRVSPLTELDDEDFHCRYRLTKDSVLDLLSLIEDKLEPHTYLNNALDPLEQLLIALRFYASGAFQLIVGDLINVSQPTVSRVLHRVSRAIASLRPQFIAMPQTERECEEVSGKFFRIAGFPNVIGAIDCSHVHILSPGGDDAERFRNRKGFFSINTQTIVSSDLVIQNVVARWPGSTHDSTILSNSTVPDMMEGPIHQKYHLLGDSGYPCRSYIMTPLNNPITPAEKRYNKSHIISRNTVERSYGILKKRFPCLETKLRCDINLVPTIIVAVCVLHNLAVKLGDPQPPIDPEVEEYIKDFVELVQNAPIHGAPNVPNDTAVGFTKRRLLIQHFF